MAMNVPPSEGLHGQDDPFNGACALILEQLNEVKRYSLLIKEELLLQIARADAAAAELDRERNEKDKLTKLVTEVFTSVETEIKLIQQFAQERDRHAKEESLQAQKLELAELKLKAIEEKIVEQSAELVAKDRLMDELKGIHNTLANDMEELRLVYEKDVKKFEDIAACAESARQKTSATCHKEKKKLIERMEDLEKRAASRADKSMNQPNKRSRVRRRRT